MAILCAVLALFAVLNLEEVRINWILVTTKMPLIIVIVLCGAVGFAAGWMFSRRGPAHVTRAS